MFDILKNHTSKDKDESRKRKNVLVTKVITSDSDDDSVIEVNEEKQRQEKSISESFDSNIDSEDIDLLLDNEMKSVYNKLHFLMDEIIALKKRIERGEKRMIKCCEKLEMFREKEIKLCSEEELRTYRMQNKMKNLNDSIDLIEKQCSVFLMKNQDPKI
uniref:Cowpox A-type inclusion protein n=1 Tax=Strongyloides venezuelensis TaxID=75913 RepID=A0A0K0G384_STRVS